MKLFLSMIIAFCISMPVHSQAGIFRRCGSGCYSRYYYAPVKTVVKEVQVPVGPQQVVNISNVYPQGNTIYGQGYGVAQVGQLYYTNPSLAITTAGNALEKMTATLQSAISSAGVNNQQLLELEKLRVDSQRVQALLGRQQPTELHLRIEQGADGIKVQRMYGPQGQGVSNGNHGSPDPSPVSGGSSIIDQQCSKCHGTQHADPPAFYISSKSNLTPDQILASLDVLRGNNVPAEMKSLVSGMSDETKGQIMSELLEMWKSSAGNQQQ